MAKPNIKKLAVDHVEKIVSGVMLLLVLAALGTTRWSGFKGTPREITDKVADGKRTLKSTVWPEDEVQKYTISREAAPANLVNERLRKEYSPSQVEVSTKMMVDPYGSSQPVTEPMLTGPQDLIASSARVFINMFDESKLTPEVKPEEADPKKPNKDDDSDRPDELRKNNNNQLGAAGMGMEMGIPQSYGAVLEMAGMPGMMPGDPMGGMGMEQKAPELKGEGYHFVSVRAVFPLREQITHYAQATNRSFHQAAATFDIRDFELERQMAQTGDNPWSGPWELVDLKLAEDILSKAEGFDAEVVNPMITNAVITMPLPSRISGRWDKQATHPRIEKFTLSDSESALEQEMQHKLLMEAVNQKKEMNASMIKRGGFSKQTIDQRQLNQDVMGIGMFQSGAGFADPMMGMGMGMGMAGGGMTPGRNRGPGAQVDPLQKLIEDMARGATNKKEEEERIRKWIQSMVTAEGELLLFRYFDFNVEPGKTYRYRVRFIVANPNYGRRIADAGGLNHVVEGETRETPWSNVTAPVTVEKDVKYFLTEVREQFPRILPMVTFDVFEWAQKHGTVVNAPLEVRFGQQLKQSKETVVIDPAKNINEKQQFAFKATDFLVDALEEVRVDEAFHEKIDDGSGVKFPVGTRGRLPVAAKVLVSNDDRNLRFMSPIAGKAEHDKQKNYMEIQKEVYEYMKKSENPGGDEALINAGLADPMMMMGAEAKPGKRGPRSQLRIKNGGAKGGAMVP